MDPVTLENIKQLTIARLRATNKDLTVHIGDDDYSQEDLLKSVMEENDLGRQVMEMHIDFLRSIASGELYSEEYEQVHPNHAT